MRQVGRMIETEEACKLVKKDPVVSLLVPQEHCRSLPIPLSLRGRPALAFFFFPIEGKAGGKKRIKAPSAKVVLDVETRRVVALATPPMCWLPSTEYDSVIGTFPPPALEGRSSSECAAEYEKYFKLCDGCCASLNAGEEYGTGPVYEEWRLGFERLCEPGMEDYYAVLMPAVEPRRSRRNDSAQVAGVTSKSEASTGTDEIVALELTPHLKRLDVLVRNLSDDRLTQMWRAIRKSIAAATYRVSVAGEFQRGKSTLINGILGEHVVPVGTTPTTSCPISIRYGRTERIRCSDEGAVGSEAPLGPAGMRAYMAEHSVSRERTGGLHIEIPNSWLKENRIELVDMPGFGIAEIDDSTEANRELSMCDAVLVCVDATIPLSLSERALLEDIVLTKKAPETAVVVTRLDQVPRAERQQLIERITHRLRDWELAVPVWTSLEEYDGHSAEMRCGLEELRLGIAACARNPGRIAMRKQQVAAQAARVCEMCQVSLQARIAAQSQAAREDMADGQKRAEMKQRWETVAGAVDECELAAERSMNDALRQLHDELKDELMHELSRTRNPREWWEKDLPYRMRRFWHRARRELEPRFAQLVAKDIASLKRALSREFSIVLRAPEASASVLPKTMDLVPSPNQLTDLDTIRLWTRVGSGVTTAVGYMILGAPALLLSLIGGIAGDRALGDKIEEQRRKLTVALDDVLDRAMQRVMENTKAYLRDVYGALAQEMNEQKAIWVAALEETDSDCDRSQTEQNALMTEIRQIHAVLSRFANETL